MCIEGICAPTSPKSCLDYTVSACRNICGDENCDNAVEPPACDMTKLGFDGAVSICAPGWTPVYIIMTITRGVIYPFRLGFS